MNCPLCKLILFKFPNPTPHGVEYEYNCPKQADNLNGNYVTHYAERVNHSWTIMIVPPFKIFNYFNSKTSDIQMKKLTEIGYRYRTVLRGIPLIHPDEEDKLVKRIQTLLTFS